MFRVIMDIIIDKVINIFSTSIVEGPVQYGSNYIQYHVYLHAILYKSDPAWDFDY